jgi:hypothetical protein
MVAAKGTLRITSIGKRHQPKVGQEYLPLAKFPVLDTRIITSRPYYPKGKDSVVIDTSELEEAERKKRLLQAEAAMSVNREREKVRELQAGSAPMLRALGKDYTENLGPLEPEIGILGRFGQWRDLLRNETSNILNPTQRIGRAQRAKGWNKLPEVFKSELAILGKAFTQAQLVIDPIAGTGMLAVPKGMETKDYILPGKTLFNKEGERIGVGAPEAVTMPIIKKGMYDTGFIPLDDQSLEHAAAFKDMWKFARGEPGGISPAAAAGRMRVTFQSRPLTSQLAAGLLFDPFSWGLPGLKAAKWTTGTASALRKTGFSEGSVEAIKRAVMRETRKAKELRELSLEEAASRYSWENIRTTSRTDFYMARVSNEAAGKRAGLYSTETGLLQDTPWRHQQPEWFRKGGDVRPGTFLDDPVAAPAKGWIKQYEGSTLQRMLGRRPQRVWDAIEEGGGIVRENLEKVRKKLLPSTAELKTREDILQARNQIDAVIQEGGTLDSVTPPLRKQIESLDLAVALQADNLRETRGILTEAAEAALAKAERLGRPAEELLENYIHEAIQRGIAKTAADPKRFTSATTAARDAAEAAFIRGEEFTAAEGLDVARIQRTGVTGKKPEVPVDPEKLGPPGAITTERPKVEIEPAAVDPKSGKVIGTKKTTLPRDETRYQRDVRIKGEEAILQDADTGIVPVARDLDRQFRIEQAKAVQTQRMAAVATLNTKTTELAAALDLKPKSVANLHATIQMLQDRALIEIMLATGARSGHIEDLTLGRLEDGLKGVEFVISQLSEGPARGNLVLILPDHLESVRGYVNEWLKAARAAPDNKRQQLGKYFPTDPDARIFKRKLTDRLKKYQKIKGLEELPTEAKQFRKMYAKRLKALGLDRSTIAYQLGHSRYSNLQEIYVGEFGEDMGPGMMELLREIGVLDKGRVARIAEAFKRANGIRRRKGMQVGEVEKKKAINELGLDVLKDLAPDISLIPKLNQLEGTGAVYDLFEVGTKLVSLKAVAYDIQKVADVLVARKAAYTKGKKVLSDEWKRTRLPEDREAWKNAVATWNELGEQVAQLKTIVSSLDAYGENQFHTLALAIAALEQKAKVTSGADNIPVLRSLWNILRPEQASAFDKSYIELQRAVSSARTAGEKKLLEDAGGNHLLVRLPVDPDDAAKTLPAVKDWMDKAQVVASLESRGARSDGGYRPIHSALTKLAKTQPDALGRGFAKLEKVDRDARIEAVASTIWSSPDLYSKLRSKATDIAEVIIKEKPPKRPTGFYLDRQLPTIVPDPYSMSAQEAVMEMRHLVNDFVPGVVSNAAVVGFLDEIRYTGVMGDEIYGMDLAGLHGIEAVQEWLAGAIDTGIAVLAGGGSIGAREVLRLMAGHMEYVNYAKAAEVNVTRAVLARFKKAGMTWENSTQTRNASATAVDYGYSKRRFSKDSLTIKEPTSDLIQKGLQEEDINGFMRDWGQVYRLDPSPGSAATKENPLLSEWDKHLEWRTPELRDAALYPLQIIGVIELMFEEARRLHHFNLAQRMADTQANAKRYIKLTDAEKIAAGREVKREPVYMPFIVETDAWSNSLKNEHKGMRTATTEFFHARESNTYANFVARNNVYIDGVEALARYVGNSHLEIAEKQLRNAVEAYALPIEGSAKTANRARALHRVRKAKEAGETISKKDIQGAEAFDDNLLEAVRIDPVNTKEAVDAAVKLAVSRAGSIAALAKRDVGVEYLKDLALPKADIRQIRKIAAESNTMLTAFTTAVAPISRTMVFLKTGFDLGSMNIHGALSLMVRGEEGSVYGRAMLNQFRVFADPKQFGDYVTKPENNAPWREMRRWGVEVGGKGEVTEILAQAPGRGAKKLAYSVEKSGAHIVDQMHKLMTGKKGKLAEKVDIGIIDRFEAAFDSTLDFVRLESWKAMRKQDMTDDQLRKLARHVNKMTGVYNTALAGMTPMQRATQTALFFAPIYRRASYGIIVDAMKLTKWNDEAVKQARIRLTSMAAAGAGMMGISYMMGNKDVFDITKPTFATVGVGDFNIGFGTAYYSLLRLSAAMFLVSMGAIGKFGDPGERALEDFFSWDNQLFRFFRAQAAPVTGLAADFAFGEKFTGDPLQDPQERGVGNQGIVHVINQFMPFWADNENRENFFQGGAVAIAAEFMGLRTYPMSVFDKRHEIRKLALETTEHPAYLDFYTNVWAKESIKEVYINQDNPLIVGQAKLGRPEWSDLPSLVKKALTEEPDANGERLRAADEAVRQHDLDTGDELDRSFISLRDKTQALRATYNARADIIQEMYDEWGQGTAPVGTSRFPDLLEGRVFRAKIREARTIYSAGIESIRNNPEFSDVFARLKENRLNSRQRTEIGYIGDLLHSIYAGEVLGNEQLEDHRGFFRPELKKEMDANWKTKYLGDDNELWEYILEKSKSGRIDSPVMEEFDDVRERVLAPYWDLHKTLLEEGKLSKVAHDLIETERGKGSASLQAQWRKSLPAYKSRFLTGKSRGSWHSVRMNWLRKNPEADLALAKFYDHTPIVRSNIITWREFLEDRGVRASNWFRPETRRKRLLNPALIPFKP